MRRRLMRKITADTLAMVLYLLATGIFGFLFERSVVGLLVWQMGGIWILGLGKYPLAELCAQLTGKLRILLMGNSRHPFRRALSAGLALSVYQVPLYVGSALCVRVSLSKVSAMAAFCLACNLIFGWLYGFILDWVRARFAVYSSEI